MKVMRAKLRASVVGRLRGVNAVAVAVVLVFGAVAVPAASAGNGHQGGSGGGSGCNEQSGASHGGGSGEDGLMGLTNLPDGLATAVMKALGAEGSPSSDTHRSGGCESKKKHEGLVHFKFSVSLGDDGCLALVGAHPADRSEDEVFVFVRLGDVWILKHEFPNPFGLLRLDSWLSSSSDDPLPLIGAPMKEAASMVNWLDSMLGG